MILLKKEQLETEIDKNAIKLMSVLQSGLTYQSPFLKGGLEFSRIKPYVPGVDPAKNIDWRISSKGRGIFVREYAVLEKLSIFIGFDTSASMGYGSDKFLKYEYAGIVAESLIKASLSSQIPVGIGFSDDKKGIGDIILPSLNPGIYSKTFDLILNREYKGRFNFSKFLDVLISRVNPNSVIILLSDFLNLGKGWEDKLLTASQKFVSFLCLSIRDPIEENLPSTSKVFRLRDPETGDIITINPERVKKLYEKAVKEEEQELKKKIEMNGAVYRKVFTNKPFVDVLIQFFRL